MKDELRCPETLQEAVKYFADNGRAFDFMKSIRWSNGNVSCPRCGCNEVSFISTRKLWTCKRCKTRKQFTIRVGTILEDSAIGFDKWLCAFWMLANAKNGISSYELGRALGVTQKTGWFMLHRVRLAMQTRTFYKLRGAVEADESFIGGAAKNMHRSKRKRFIRGTGGLDKTPVLGMLERSKGVKLSRVRAVVIKNLEQDVLRKQIMASVKKGSKLYTDTAFAYTKDRLPKMYEHEAINPPRE